MALGDQVVEPHAKEVIQGLLHVDVDAAWLRIHHVEPGDILVGQCIDGEMLRIDMDHHVRTHPARDTQV